MLRPEQVFRSAPDATIWIVLLQRRAQTGLSVLLNKK